MNLRSHLALTSSFCCVLFGALLSSRANAEIFSVSARYISNSVPAVTGKVVRTNKIEFALPAGVLATEGAGTDFNAVLKFRETAKDAFVSCTYTGVPSSNVGFVNEQVRRRGLDRSKKLAYPYNGFPTKVLVLTTCSKAELSIGSVVSAQEFQLSVRPVKATAQTPSLTIAAEIRDTSEPTPTPTPTPVPTPTTAPTAAPGPETAFLRMCRDPNISDAARETIARLREHYGKKGTISCEETDLTLRQIKEIRMWGKFYTENEEMLMLAAKPCIVTDLSPLADFTQIESLDIQRCPVKDLSPLSRLQNLKSIELSGAKISDCTALVGLMGLRNIYFERDAVIPVCIENFKDRKEVLFYYFK